MDLNMILDALTILTTAISLLFIIENFLLYVFTWDVTWPFLRMNWNRKPGFIRWKAGGGWAIHEATPDPMNPKKWILSIGGKEIPYELKEHSKGLGPCKTELVLISDENSGGATIPVGDLLSGNAIGATPAHIDALEKARYAQGFNDGFNKSNPGGVLDWARDNFGVIVTIFIIAIVGTLLLYDKVISSPAAWSAANQCEGEKAILLGKLAQTGVDINQIVNPQSATTTTLPAIQNVGAIIK